MSDTGSGQKGQRWRAGGKTTKSSQRNMAQYSGGVQYSESQALAKLKAVKAPEKGGATSVDFGNGYSATFSHVQQGYGTGGIIQTIVKEDGKIIDQHRERWGGSGMATAMNGSKAEAFKAAKAEVEYYARQKPKKERAPF